MDALALSDGKLPSEVAPIYKNGTTYFYYIPKCDEWWIGDWIRQRHGYVTRDMKDVPKEHPRIDPLKLPGDGWSYVSFLSSCTRMAHKRMLRTCSVAHVIPSSFSVHSS